MTMNDRMRNIQSLVDQRKGKRDLLKEQIIMKRKEIKETKEKHQITKKAHVIIQRVAKDTQEQLQYRLSNLASLAMESVFNNPYKINIHFVERRGKTEVDVMFERDGQEVEPVFATGGGAIDVAAFALQMSIMCLITPKVRNTLILDEPLKWLKGNDLPDKGSQMIKSISEKLGIQIISVSHSPEIIEASDNIISIAQTRGVSYVAS